MQRAFESKWWNASGRFRITDAGTLVSAPVLGFTQMELNFSMFWGIAVMLYEATLISDDSPFDRGELSAAAERGLVLFNDRRGARAAAAAGSATLLPLGTQAAQLAGDPPFVTIQTVSRPNGLLDGSGNPVMHATRCATSASSRSACGRWPRMSVAGGTDPYGGPLSFSRKSIAAGTNPGGVTRTIVDGSFKVAAAAQRRADAALLPQRRLRDLHAGAGLLPARRQPARRQPDRARAPPATIPAPASRARG